MTDAPEYDPLALQAALAELRAAGEDDAADALLEAAGQAGAVGKAMSTLTLADGGALVPPATCRKPNKVKRRQIKRAVRKALEGY